MLSSSLHLQYLLPSPHYLPLDTPVRRPSPSPRSIGFQSSQSRLPSLSSIEIQSTLNSVSRPTGSLNFWSIRIQWSLNSGLSQRPSLSSIGKQQSSNSGPSRRPRLSSNTSFQVIKIQVSSILGRQSLSGLGRMYHQPNQYLSSIQIQTLSSHGSHRIFKFHLSIIHRPRPRFALRSLDPREGTGKRGV